MSAKDRRGSFGYSGTKYGIKVILGLGGTRYYVPVCALDQVVGTIEREEIHCILFSRDPFSDGQWGKRPYHERAWAIEKCWVVEFAT